MLLQQYVCAFSDIYCVLRVQVCAMPRIPQVGVLFGQQGYPE